MLAIFNTFIKLKKIILRSSTTNSLIKENTVNCSDREQT